MNQAHRPGRMVSADDLRNALYLIAFVVVFIAWTSVQ